MHEHHTTDAADTPPSLRLSLIQLSMLSLLLSNTTQARTAFPRNGQAAAPRAERIRKHSTALNLPVWHLDAPIIHAPGRAHNCASRPHRADEMRDPPARLLPQLRPSTKLVGARVVPIAKLVENNALSCGLHPCGQVTRSLHVTRRNVDQLGTVRAHRRLALFAHVAACGAIELRLDCRVALAHSAATLKYCAHSAAERIDASLHVAACAAMELRLDRRVALAHSATEHHAPERINTLRSSLMLLHAAQSHSDQIA